MNGQLFQTATGFSFPWGRRRTQKRGSTGGQQADAVTDGQPSFGYRSAANRRVADDAKVLLANTIHFCGAFDSTRLPTTFGRGLVDAAAGPCYSNRPCPMSRVRQGHTREAAEAASDLVSAGTLAVSGGEAAPIVFLHGVGLGMVRNPDPCRHPAVAPLH